MQKTWILFAVLLLLLCWSGIGLAKAPEPMDAIRKPVEQGLELVNDPTYRKPEKQEELREKIWNLVKDVFDFRAISMRALGRNWRDFSAPQRDRFTEAFTELLKNTYLNRVKGEERSEKVEFLEQDVITDNRAVVRTLLHTEDTQIPIDYSLLLRDDEWRVYDVNIEGVSMVKNYRTQFAEILNNESPDALIQRVKEKNIENREERTQKATDNSRATSGG